MFQPEERSEIPYTDLLTWTFGNDTYDHDKPIFVNAHKPEESLSYNESKALIHKLIAGFQENGLHEGDSVLLHSHNSIYGPIVYLAVIGAGGCFVPSNPAYTASELVHLLSISQTKFILTEPELLQNIQIAAENTRIPALRIFVFDTESTSFSLELKSWKSLLEHGERAWISFDDEILAKGTTAALLSTSGTTGFPKAAQSSHYSQVAQSVMLHEQKKPYEVSKECTTYKVAQNNLYHKIRRLIFLPQFHAFNAPLALVAPIREGHTTYVMKRYNQHEMVPYIKRYQITETTMVNPIIYALLDSSDLDNSALTSLRAIFCGGVPLKATVQNRLQDLLHADACVSQVWGMTEIFWVTSLRYPEKDATASAGRLLPNMEARILDPEGADIQGDDIQGHIVVQGPSMMMGYLNNEEATKSTIIDGWLHTGDIGFQKAGKWYIVDRAKEMIKVRGWQVSPTEIEACLLTHPAISDAAVVGIDFDDKRGELPRAYIVVNPAMAECTSNKDIEEHVNERLAKYKALEGGIKRRQIIPRNPAGKILKKVLREEAILELAIEEDLRSKSLQVATQITVKSPRKHPDGISVAEVEDTVSAPVKPPHDSQ